MSKKRKILYFAVIAVVALALFALPYLLQNREPLPLDSGKFTHISISIPASADEAITISDQQTIDEILGAVNAAKRDGDVNTPEVVNSLDYRLELFSTKGSSYTIELDENAILINTVNHGWSCCADCTDLFALLEQARVEASAG